MFTSLESIKKEKKKLPADDVEGISMTKFSMSD
jgi:hypothetical protein